MIATVEADIVSTLDKLVGNKVKSVEALPAEWDDDMMRRMLLLVPCLLVAFAGGAPRQVGEMLPSIEGQWIVYACTGHASGQEARRLGDAQDVGAYELLDRVVVPGLHNHTVPGVGSLMLTRLENVFSGVVERQGLAVYAATFSIPMEFDPVTDPADLADFKTFDAQYDVKPFTPANYPAWLTGDYSTSRPDAHDQVDLPQTLV